MITGEQIWAARKLLGWHRGMVALKARAGVSGNTVGKAEGAYPGSPPTPEQLAAIQEALEAAGVEFTNGDEPSVKLKRTGPQGGKQVGDLNAENDG
jgi:transcriptional regulator with XRE-family HTH domain